MWARRRGPETCGEPIGCLAALFCCHGLKGLDRNEYALVFAAAELHHAVDFGEQRVVAAHADVRSGMTLRPALAHENVAGHHLLPAIALDAEHLRVAVAAVAG